MIVTLSSRLVLLRIHNVRSSVFVSYFLFWTMRGCVGPLGSERGSKNFCVFFGGVAKGRSIPRR